MRQKNNSILSVLKDYAVPLVGLWIILLIIYFSFFGSSNNQTISEDSWFPITLSSTDDEVYIESSWEVRKKVEGSSNKLLPWEKISVKEGSVKLIDPTIWDFHINRLWEFKYLEDKTFVLYSSDVWVGTKSSLEVDVIFGSVNISPNSYVNLIKNEVAATVYVLSGSAEIKNKAGKSTVVGSGQKITILVDEAQKEDIDLTLKKEDIDTTFKMSDWYIKNNGDSYLNSLSLSGAMSVTWSLSLSWSVSNTWVTQVSQKLISLDNLSDEQTFSEPTIIINGSYFWNDITSIKLNSQEAILDTTEKRFSIKDFPLNSASNELVFKVYNASNELLWKYPYTVYLKWWKESNQLDVKNFSLDSKDFKFISPKSNPYTTSDDVVMIEWIVPAKTVSYIIVNDFRLWKFPKNGTYWKYFANVKSDNLKEGLNVYEVKYYDANDKVLHTNAFTIIKTPASTLSWSVTQ